ncbi:MAG: FdhF/YdeP family oxidoreductase [Blastocatellia bacterium]|nr:FdhF/YdeP family oxidoreductase [Blastocatellia bacterium]MCS7156310.1 FdhF/YdeP family oxidoreductase [Blastocatellia bacterium]MDW8169052.1 FdhF/YdeP family oxidoreductase [Acidobacteriota bacterium]MDW8256412.1 FdhF/YdeP family oxidoreductase [Acidobacteriota bacterium]
MRGERKRQIASYLEVFRAVWENRDRLGYAWRILTQGVCDGCALGTSGLRDWTISGIHLCWIRLRLLRLNTMGPLDIRLLDDVTRLQAMSEPELRGLGRIPRPLVRRRGDTGFQPISWNEALELIAERVRATTPERLAFYVASRGTVNETYYVAQKVARLLGTNHIDNSARVCHAPSTTALKQTIGYAASTCSYRDWIGTDLLVLIGSDIANNQPVAMKYIHLAKKQGTRVVVINPYREPGLEKYWVPSSLDSALFGTRVADAFFQIRVGGDIAFLNGVLKHLIANGWVDRAFIAEHTEGWEELVRALDEQRFEHLERLSGTTRECMLDFARLYARAQTAVFIWSMGVTMHEHGVANVKAIVNLALARGMIGRPHCGLVAIRGHSGVQGGAEMGAVPNQFPGGLPITEQSAEQLAAEWGFPVPAWRGYFVAEMIEAAHRGELDVFYLIGSNLTGILPESQFVREALARIPLRVHHDIVLNPQMFVEPADTVLILPATTRYEMAGGNTETTTERRILFNPEIPGPRLPEARDEWRALVGIAQRVRPEWAAKIAFPSTAAIRAEIARIVPFYGGIQDLRQRGDQIQWGGPRLGEGGQFPTPSGRARFTPLVPPEREVPEGRFHLTTRRGKQFNSMVFHPRDVLAEAHREDVILAPEDMQRLGLRDGDPVLVRSEVGEFHGRARSGPIYPGTAMMYWPEANVLIPRGAHDPECGMPAFRSAIVEILPDLGRTA